MVSHSRNLIKVGAAIFGSLTLCFFVACSDATAPAIVKAAPKAVATIFCNPDGSCYSDGNENNGPQLTLQVKSGCVPENLEKLPGSCQPHAFNFGGGTSGSYSVRYFASICWSNGTCDTNYELGSSPTITFASDTYEIDVTAELQEIGGTQLTGVATTQVMGPSSTSTGSGFAVDCPSNSGSMFAPFPFDIPAYSPTTGQQLRDANGNPLYKSYAREPCSGLIVYDPGEAHTL
jgi:hypothetical protein